MESSRQQWLEVRAPDGHYWRAELCSRGAPTAVVVVLAAMGVRASFYRPLAAELSQHGYAVVTSDLRGHGQSSVRPSRNVDYGYYHVCELDIPALLGAVRDRFPHTPVVLCGHSLGGQAATMYAAAEPEAIAGLVLITSGSPHSKNFAGPMRAVAWALGKLAPALGRALGHYPGQLLGFGGREARTLMRDWAHAVATGRFEPRGSSRDYEALFRTSTTPMLALSVEGDTWCPPAAVADLIGRLERAEIESLHLGRSDTDGLAYDHFHWARAPGPMVRAMLPWLSRHVGR